MNVSLCFLYVHFGCSTGKEGSRIQTFYVQFNTFQVFYTPITGDMYKHPEEADRYTDISQVICASTLRRQTDVLTYYR